MTRSLRNRYMRLRDESAPAIYAIRAARAMERWDALEAAGFVRFELTPDDGPDLSWLDQDCYKNTREGRAAAKQVREQVERDGVWCLASEVRDVRSGQWETADSICGLIGYSNPADERENPYVYDLAFAAVGRLREQLKDRFCPHCGRRHCGN